MKIGIIGAMESEVSTLKETMKADQVITKAGMNFYEGILEGTPVVVVRSGIGKVNAAVCVQILADMFEVTHVLNTGIAGSLNAKLDIGDILVSEKAIQHDVDATVFGYAPGQIPGFDSREFRADKEMADTVITACHHANPDVNIVKGCVVSGDQFISSAEKKDYLIATFEGDCAEMEGAAMAQAAYLNQIPFLIIRAISDKADNSSHMDYPEFEKQAIVHTIKLLEEMYKNL